MMRSWLVKDAKAGKERELVNRVVVVVVIAAAVVDIGV